MLKEQGKKLINQKWVLDKFNLKLRLRVHGDSNLGLEMLYNLVKKNQQMVMSIDGNLKLKVLVNLMNLR